MMNLRLIADLVKREVTGRYRGSVLGVLWSLLTPMFMLAVYTLVFGVVLQARWVSPAGQEAGHTTAEFAVILFGGLVVFQFFSEVVGNSTSLVLGNRNYVKRIVFPIHILPIVATGSALFHFLVSFLILAFFAAFALGSIPPMILFVPIVIAPLAILTLGLAWFLASAGVYFRDIGQIVPPFLTALMFLSPIFFPRTALPGWLQPYLSLNPLTIPVETLRNVALFGQQPDWTALGYYSLVAIAVALLGERFFQLTRRGFADVL